MAPIFYQMFKHDYYCSLYCLEELLYHKLI